MASQPQPGSSPSQLLETYIFVIYVQNSLSAPIFSTPGPFLKFSMTSSAQPSTQPLIVTRDLYFCNLLTEISFPTNFRRNPLSTSLITRPQQRLKGAAPPFVDGRRNYHFCSLHTEISLRTNFQQTPSIWKFSMTSPTRQAYIHVILQRRWRIRIGNQSRMANQG